MPEEGIPELFHHVRVREVVHDVLQDSLVVGVAQRTKHQDHGDVSPDVRQLRPDVPPVHLAVLASLKTDMHRAGRYARGGAAAGRGGGEKTKRNEETREWTVWGGGRGHGAGAKDERGNYGTLSHGGGACPRHCFALLTNQTGDIDLRRGGRQDKNKKHGNNIFEVLRATRPRSQHTDRQQFKNKSVFDTEVCKRARTRRTKVESIYI